MSTKLAIDASLNVQHTRLLGLLKEHAYERREITLSSGKKSNFYIDCKRVSLLAEGHALIGKLLVEAIRKECPEAVAVGGLTLGADPIASAAAHASFLDRGHRLDAFIVRKEPKGHGTGMWLEGANHLPAGARVAIVEDVVTTGRSTLLAVERTQSAGFRVERVFTLVDRQEGGSEAVSKVVPLSSLFVKSDFE